MFGIARAFEGCRLFKDTVMKREKFMAWYERMKLALVEGYKEDAEIKIPIEESKPSESEQKPIESDLKIIDQEQKPTELELVSVPTKVEVKLSEPEPKPIELELKLSEHEQIPIKLEPKAISDEIQIQPENHVLSPVDTSKEISPLVTFRILTLTYLIHVAVFTYAAWNSK